MLRVFILLLLPLASTNISQEELNDYDLLTNFTKYNDPDLSHVLDQAIPSTIYNYITNKYMNDDNSIENEPALIYELAPFTSHYVPELQAKIRILVPSGRFKLAPNSPSRQDGKLFQFCPPSKVEEQLKLLYSLYEQYEYENIDPIVLAAWFHAEFIRIHPFVDGNGRLGRFLSSKILMKYDLFPLIVEKQNRAEYIECMNESIAQNNLTSLINFIKREQNLLIEHVRKQTTYSKQKYPVYPIDN
ncbi:unnamed protein product [Rotaria magnacalcarata]|uniref:Fido domain-containing protein n=1 Tax=Rotaria magnacalcarata TaxID=392030 RepID=A0A815PI83_9BILA|nr:unnamed protein product [Rotaria magnacalcarata]CAF2085007.1 unnamed protein product [Rotaria magnacalcarata]CAF2188196.1 unnamed protein product [Rotaria magnacalcarata]CAF3913882.1 unnamed protein product [Rotaria magnacalcarata]CAF4019294.1 unnamed protein product [Rotaria magnacalcarata]